MLMFCSPIVGYNFLKGKKLSDTTYEDGQRGMAREGEGNEGRIQRGREEIFAISIAMLEIFLKL